jgi:hypothetical protein
LHAAGFLPISSSTFTTSSELVLRIAVGVILLLISDATEEAVALGVVLPLGANEEGVVLPELIVLVVGLGESIIIYFISPLGCMQCWYVTKREKYIK